MFETGNPPETQPRAQLQAGYKSNAKLTTAPQQSYDAL